MANHFCACKAVTETISVKIGGVWHDTIIECACVAPVSRANEICSDCQNHKHK